MDFLRNIMVPLAQDMPWLMPVLVVAAILIAILLALSLVFGARASAQKSFRKDNVSKASKPKQEKPKKDKNKRENKKPKRQPKIPSMVSESDATEISQVIQRANIHGASGNTDKAEVLLKTTLTKYPNNLELSSALLSLYGDAQNIENFSALYETTASSLRNQPGSEAALAKLASIKTNYFDPDAQQSAYDEAAISTDNGAVFDMVSEGHDVKANTESMSSYEKGLYSRMQNGDMDAAALLLTVYGNRQNEAGFHEIYEVANQKLDQNPDNIADRSKIEQLKERFFSGAPMGDTLDMSEVAQDEVFEMPVHADAEDVEIVTETGEFFMPEHDDVPEFEIGAEDALPAPTYNPKKITRTPVFEREGLTELNYLNQTRIEYAEAMIKANKEIEALQLFEKVLSTNDDKFDDIVKAKIIAMMVN